MVLWEILFLKPTQTHIFRTLNDLINTEFKFPILERRNNTTTSCFTVRYWGWLLLNTTILKCKIMLWTQKLMLIVEISSKAWIQNVSYHANINWGIQYFLPPTHPFMRGAVFLGWYISHIVGNVGRARTSLWFWKTVTGRTFLKVCASVVLGTFCGVFGAETTQNPTFSLESLVLTRPIISRWQITVLTFRLASEEATNISQENHHDVPGHFF